MGVSDDFRGTCKTATEEEEKKIEEEGEIELCEVCSWWEEVCELELVDGQLICSDCKDG